MNKITDVIKRTRIKLFELIEDLNAEQLNQIPDGFTNNIIWNVGHMISSQQGLCYLKAGLRPCVD
ncbi:MAG: DinB family protein, partial [Sphingobacterium sp.]